MHSLFAVCINLQQLLQIRHVKGNIHCASSQKLRTVIKINYYGIISNILHFIL